VVAGGGVLVVGCGSGEGALVALARVTSDVADASDGATVAALASETTGAAAGFAVLVPPQ
jgi:hypothetical protein